MKKFRSLSFLVPVAVLALAALACGLPGSALSVKQPTAPIAPMTIGSDLTQVDVCAAVPAADMEAVMGRKLASAPQAFNYYDTSGVGGCMFEAGKDSSGNAYFSYIALTPVEVYNDQPLYLNVDVSSLGEEAYFNNGADARQLWVKVNDRLAFVVGIGDQPNEDGARALAEMVLAAIK
jgi:hypothetical protein